MNLFGDFSESEARVNRARDAWLALLEEHEPSHPWAVQAKRLWIRERGRHQALVMGDARVWLGKRR